MKHLGLVGIIAIILLMNTCSTMRVRSDYDEDIDFSRYRTFRIVTQDRRSPALKSNPLLEKRIVEAIRAELQLKGLKEIAGERPDLLVGFHTGIRNRVVTTERWYPYRWRHPARRVNIENYKEGTLVVDLIDTELQNVVWRGWAAGAISSPDEADETIKKAVTEVMEKYPPD
jgi:hypothetical protein